MSNLGRPKPHSTKQIRQRREKVLILLSKGMNQTDIAKELDVNRNTVMRDIKELNEWTRKGLYDMAKQSLPTMLYSCLIGLNEAEKEAWKLYNNEDNDPEITRWHKVAALRLLIDVNKSKFKMFQDGPAFMEINRLQGEIERIKEQVHDNSFRPFVKSSTYEESKRLRELSLSESDTKELVNDAGKHYRIKEVDCSQELEKEKEDEEEDEDSELDKEDHELNE